MFIESCDCCLLNCEDFKCISCFSSDLVESDVKVLTVI